MALVATMGTFLVFCGTTLVDEPATVVAMVAILVVATAADLLWKRSRANRGRALPTGDADTA